MPWPGPRRIAVAVRLRADGIAAVDALALRRGLTIRNGEPNRSEMVRRLLAEALALPHNRA
jgi:hypothetical protein